MRFILIDDDPVNNLISKVTIEGILDKVEIYSFTNAEKGLEFVRSGQPALKNGDATILLLDLNMPVMDGWEFLKRFMELGAEIKRRIRLYILSSSVDVRDKERSRANKDVMDYLIKPLTQEDVSRIYPGSTDPPHT